jgi:single-stranded DNA-specific DHH superfamily exonuclease
LYGRYKDLRLYLMSLYGSDNMPEETVLKKGFWEEIKRVSEQLKEEEDFLVVSHHDADGMTACAIMVDEIRRLHDTEAARQYHNPKSRG